MQKTLLAHNKPDTMIIDGTANYETYVVFEQKEIT